MNSRGKLMLDKVDSTQALQNSASNPRSGKINLRGRKKDTSRFPGLTVKPRPPASPERPASPEIPASPDIIPASPEIPENLFNESDSNCSSSSSSNQGKSDSSSSSSSNSSSRSSSSSSSEDCEDLLYDQTYEPKPDEEDESGEEGDDHSKKNGSNKNEVVGTNADTTVNVSPFIPNSASTSITLNSSNNTSQEIPIFVSPAVKCSKRKRNPDNWKRNIAKRLRNTGAAYETTTKKVKKSREMKPPCGEKCRFECASKVSTEDREKLFASYWSLGSLEQQRQFIASSMVVVKPKYTYVRVGKERRKNNNAFFFSLNGQKIRVCKVFFRNTLDINDRPIRTVIAKRNQVGSNLVETEKRGKHGNQKKLDPAIREGIRKHIESIPKIESHYTRANTSRQFIDGSRSLAEIHRDYVANCKENQEPYGELHTFQRVLTNEFNISFFVPKKDLCDICEAFKNVTGEEKDKLKPTYDQHLEEKDLSRAEKKKDKDSKTGILAVYDLQAVMQLPKGDVSVFYYKSKLNVLNFTIYDLHNNTCECYVWEESNAHRGSNEICTCVLKYLQKKAEAAADTEVTFYSDNCSGQQKNKFMVGLYIYAVRILGLKSITHKFLVKGHTQNEGDSAHSLIERQVKRTLRSGPIYTTEGFISAIKAARKRGEPFSVTELTYEDFYNMKALTSDIGPLNMTNLKLKDVKVIQIRKESPSSVFFKNSYTDTEFQEVKVIRKKVQTDVSKITLKPAFSAKPGLDERKRQDLLDLLHKNLIPKMYQSFYVNL